MSDTATEPKPKLRWYQYRLWHLFALMTVAAIGCSWFVCRMQKAKRQKAAVEAIEGMGGAVEYDYEINSGGWERRLPGATWFRNLVGVDFLADVVNVYLGGTQVQVNDAELVHLEELTNLQGLYLGGSQVTDAGLEHLKGLTELQRLGLSRTEVTRDGLKRLQQSLPNCHISHWSSTEHFRGIRPLRRKDLENSGEESANEAVQE